MKAPKHEMLLLIFLGYLSLHIGIGLVAAVILTFLFERSAQEAIGAGLLLGIGWPSFRYWVVEIASGMIEEILHHRADWGNQKKSLILGFVVGILDIVCVAFLILAIHTASIILGLDLFSAPILLILAVFLFSYFLAPGVLSFFLILRRQRQ